MQLERSLLHLHRLLHLRVQVLREHLLQLLQLFVAVAEDEVKVQQVVVRLVGGAVGRRRRRRRVAVVGAGRGRRVTMETVVVGVRRRRTQQLVDLLPHLQSRENKQDSSVVVQIKRRCFAFCAKNHKGHEPSQGFTTLTVERLQFGVKLKFLAILSLFVRTPPKEAIPPLPLNPAMVIRGQKYLSPSAAAAAAPFLNPKPIAQAR